MKNLLGLTVEYQEFSYVLKLIPPSTFCKGVQLEDSLEFWIPSRGCWILGTEFRSLSVELGFCIIIFRRIPDSLSCNPDSKALRVEDSTRK